MKQSKYREVESILKGLPEVKVKIKNLKLSLEELQEIVGIRGESPNEKAGSSTHAFSSAVEDEVIRRDEKLSAKIESVEMEIRQLERKVEKVENVMGLLTEREQLLIEMRYFKGYSVNRICEVLDMSNATFNRRRADIIQNTLIPNLLGSATKVIGK